MFEHSIKCHEQIYNANSEISKITQWLSLSRKQVAELSTLFLTRDYEVISCF